ncbi:hypothetical protein FGF1_03370 [Flavobacteriaceae bacterium GF1]
MAEGQILGKDVINDDVFERLNKFVTSLDDIILRFDKVEKTGRSASSSIAFAEAEKENAEAIKKSNSALTERQKLENRISTQTEKIRAANSDLGRQYAQQRVELTRLNRENRTQETIVNKNERAYKRLSLQYNEAKKDLKDLIVTIGQYTPAAQRQAREVERLGQKIKTADAIAGDFQRNVGNYPSALRPAIGVVRQLIGVFGVVEGIRLGARLVADLSRIAREARGVDFAFERLGNNATQAFEKTRESTRGLISELDLKRAIVQFDNFNLSLEQINTLLEFAAVRSAQTGENFEFMLNSLVEGLARESLRRLDNLGVSMNDIKNTSKELGVSINEAFTILAGQEVERAGNILDEAANGGQRFNASLENIKQSVGDNINTFKGFGIVNTFLERTNLLVKIQGEFLNGNISLIDRLKAGFGFLSSSRAEENRQLLEEIENRRKLKKEIDAQIEAYGKLNNITGQGPLEEGQGGFDFLTGPEQENAIKTLETINQDLEKQRRLLEATDVTDKKRLRTIADKINALKAEREAILSLLDTEERANRSRREFIDTFELDSEATINGTIGYLKNLRSAVSIGGAEWINLTAQIEDFEKTLTRLREQATLSVEDIAFIDSDAAQDALDVQNFLNTEGIEIQALELSKFLKQNQEELLSEYDSLYERDFDNFLKWAKAKTEAEIEENNARERLLNDSLSVAQDFAQAFFEIQANRIDDEISKQNDAFDAIVNNKNSSEEQIRIAELKRDENEKRLLKEQEKRQRRAFLLQQAFEVAKVWIADATARANALASTSLIPFPGNLAAFASMQGIITTNTAIALGAILAQSLPAFFKGKNYTDKYEGPATWGERGREVKIGSDGSVELSPNRTTPLYVKRDDIITPTVSDFQRKMKQPGSEVFKRVVGNKYKADTDARMRVVHISGQRDSETADLIRETNRLLKKMNRRPINVNSNVVIKKPSKFFAA